MDVFVSIEDASHLDFVPCEDGVFVFGNAFIGAPVSWQNVPTECTKDRIYDF